MRKEAWEMLEEINTDTSAVSKYKDNTLLKLLVQNNFVEENKWVLPEGEPPYKPTAEVEGFAPNNLYMECKRFYVLRRQDLTPVRREQIFIGMLESVDPKEAKILLAIKDQTLSKLYPNITKEVVKELL